jgi:hypothetical protein
VPIPSPCPITSTTSRSRLQIFDGDELIFDGSEPSTNIVIEPSTGVADIIAALGWDRAPEGADDATKTGSDVDPAL